ncbi:uncharacterized protein EV154DRAFT_487179 [Mucor mucedo]|uniref:uncharacterized protein n=1 Tax=Mucor mucedo TaxID=29922 RepID=UPI00221FC5BB|nr:uncharacterized protein EV154DRAFT_487179 [Mucor mucedo]KAI7873489.1 hypothetical protein EV154DRAFT_487179 [Mucor mucedo]
MLIGFFLTILCVYNDGRIDIKQLFLIVNSRLLLKEEREKVKRKNWTFEPTYKKSLSDSIKSECKYKSRFENVKHSKQSTALPIGRRPMAVPMKRIAGENQDGSFSDGQHSKYQTKLLKAAGKRLHVLFKEFKYRALAIVIPYSVAAFERWSREKFKKFISIIKQDKALTRELQYLQLRSTFLDKTGELHYIYYKDRDYIYCNDIQNNKEVHFCYLAFIQGRSVSLTLIVTK